MNIKDKDQKSIQSTALEQSLDNFLEELHQVEDKQIRKIDSQHFLIKDQKYEVAIDHQSGFDFDAFSARYQEYFEKFDFIVGDWAFQQLRLRGFYQLGTSKVPFDQRIDSLEDYLNEYCNFGSAYFLVGKKEALEEYPELLRHWVEMEKERQTYTAKLGQPYRTRKRRINPVEKNDQRRNPHDAKKRTRHSLHTSNKSNDFKSKKKIDNSFNISSKSRKKENNTKQSSASKFEKGFVIKQKSH